jgi:hypothetical protein
MFDPIYNVSLYIPSIHEDVIDVQNLEKICCQFDVDHSDAWSGSGMMCFHENLDQSVWCGCSYTASVKQSQLVEFIQQLPKEIIIDEITYTPNLKSNAWIQTDDLVAKYYDPENIPQLCPVYVPEKHKYQSSIRGEATEMATQTEPYEMDDLGSESGTSSNSSKYDTEYSLEMWEYYRHESVIYTHPLLHDLSTIKHTLTPLEEKIVKLCSTFEHNLTKYFVTSS